jgi:hypothetical protein
MSGETSEVERRGLGCRRESDYRRCGGNRRAMVGAITSAAGGVGLGGSRRISQIRLSADRCTRRRYTGPGSSGNSHNGRGSTGWVMCRGCGAWSAEIRLSTLLGPVGGAEMQTKKTVWGGAVRAQAGQVCDGARLSTGVESTVESGRWKLVTVPNDALSSDSRMTLSQDNANRQKNADARTEINK